MYRGVCSRKYTIPPPTKTGANKREPPPLFARLLDGPTSQHFNNAAIAKFTIILLRRHLHAPHKSSPILSSFVPSPLDLLFVGRRSTVELFTRESISRENNYRTFYAERMNNAWRINNKQYNYLVIFKKNKFFLSLFLRYVFNIFRLFYIAKMKFYYI